MCLIERPRNALVRREDDWDAPRPVSNYHGGSSRRARSHRRSSSSVPERVYRSSYRESSRTRTYEPTVTRVSRTYIREHKDPQPLGWGGVHYVTARATQKLAATQGQHINILIHFHTITITATMNRSHSVKKGNESSGSKLASHFKLSSLRGIQQPELSKKLYKLIKAQNQVIGAYETAGKESSAIAGQLSDWGESTEDEALSDISDKLAVLLSEIGEQEEHFSQNLEESRTVLKGIRDTEKSVQPSRDHKAKIADEIQKLKYKEPESTKLPTLEQELVRAEAQSLVAEAQLTNVTRQKFKDAFDLHTAAIIERAEKQILLANAARQVLNLLDDTPIVPGEERPAFTAGEKGREALNEVEDSLRAWTPSYKSVHSSGAQLGTNAMPIAGGETTAAAPAAEPVAETPAKTETAAVAA